MACLSTQTNKNMSVISYNSTGYSKFKWDFLFTLAILHSASVIAVQEHWQLKPNLYKLMNGVENYLMFSLPAVKKTDIIRSGRPSAGLAIFYSKQIAQYVTHIDVPNSSRVHAIQINFPAESLVFINSYFPTDPRKNNFDESELFNILQDIDHIFNKCGPHMKYILLGDVNADFSRHTRFVQIINNYIEDKNMQSIWDNYPCDFTYSQTQTRNNITRTYQSTIDHFIISENLIDQCTEACPIHRAENPSNHSPIYLKFSYNQNVDLSAILDENSDLPPKPAWNRATAVNIESYNRELRGRLSQIPYPEQALNCSDLHCSNPTHLAALDLYGLQLMECITESVNNNIPRTQSNNRKVLPGWSEHIKPLKDESIYWHTCWKNAGRPENNQLHRQMRRSRNDYHQAIRVLRQNEKAIRKDRFINDYLNGNVNNILKEIRNMRNNKVSPPIIDGVMGAENIAKHFKNIYSELYNTHDDNNELSALLNEINPKIDNSSLDKLSQITPQLISKLIRGMKNGKNDVNFDWRSDAIKHGHLHLSPIFADLFKAYLTHNHVTDVFLKSALIPIIKDPNSNHSVSNNYRAIAISSIMMKLFDLVLMTIEKRAFTTSCYQFGFESNSSTTLCTWAVTETVNFFTNRGSTVYACFLDLKKAFDMIKLSKLFGKLVDKMSPIFLRFLMKVYTNQVCYVRWNQKASEIFSTSNGVRQGATSSPSLFAVYIDELFEILDKSGIGCHINNQFVGCVGYADDIVLLSPTRCGLQKMINICSDYFDSHGIVISCDPNPKKSKTKCIVFHGSQDSYRNLQLNDISIPWTNMYKHLGHYLYDDELPYHDMYAKRGEFIGNFHALTQELGDQNPNVVMKLTQVYLCAFYGSNLWDLSSPEANKLWTTWNSLIKTTYLLPHASHRYLINTIYCGQHLKNMLISRFINFYSMVKSSSKSNVKTLFMNQCYDIRSTFGRNCDFIRTSMNADNIEQVNIKNPVIYPVPPNEQWRVPLAKELVEVKFNTKEIINTKGLDTLNCEEIDLLIDFIFTL